MKINKILRVAYGIEDLKEATETVILPQAIERFDSKLAITKAITIDTSDESKKKGSKVTVDYPIEFGDADNMNDDRSGVDSEIELKQTEIVLDRYIHKQFPLKETEILGTRSDFILSGAQMAAIDSVARSVEKAIYGEVYKSTALFAGDLASTNPKDRIDVVGARKALKKHGLVEEDRKFLMHEDTEADLMIQMSTNSLSSDEKLMREGSLGRRFGFDLFSGTYAPEHDAGTAQGNAGLTVNVGVKDAEVITISGFNVGETLNDGDILMLADGTSFSVKGDHTAAAADMAVAVYQVIEADLQAGVAVTVADSHNIDLALHSSAATVAFRKLESVSGDNQFAVNMTHPATGIPLTLRYWTEHGGRVSKWAVECLFGIKAFNDLGRCVRVGGH
ncbi:P22 phage major capsid protein family protein [Vibrio parahaemolyticus]|nr:P22 phage major capsid protein family protein [Vibrio parahaemolyticus]